MTDRAIPRTVVIALAIGVIAGLGVEGYLATTGTAIPDQFDRLVTFLAGALTSVLAKTTMSVDTSEESTPVTVVNPPEDAVQVETAKKR